MPASSSLNVFALSASLWFIHSFSARNSAVRQSYHEAAGIVPSVGMVDPSPPLPGPRSPTERVAQTWPKDDPKVTPIWHPFGWARDGPFHVKERGKVRGGEAGGKSGGRRGEGRELRVSSFEFSGTGCSLLDVGCWILDAGAVGVRSSLHNLHLLRQPPANSGINSQLVHQPVNLPVRGVDLLLRIYNTHRE